MKQLTEVDWRRVSEFVNRMVENRKHRANARKRADRRRRKAQRKLGGK